MSTPAVTPDIPSDIAAPSVPAAGGQGPTFNNGDGGDSWVAAATPPAPTPTGADVKARANAAGPEPDADAGNMPGATAPPAMPAPELPVITSNKPGGIAGVMQSIMGALVGKTKPEMGTDQYGNQYVKQTKLSGGEQWVRLAGEALQGAAEGLANGKGAGNMGKGLLAGVNAGIGDNKARQEQTAQMTDQAQKQNLANMNNQMLRMQIAEQAFKATRLGVEAKQHDIEFAQGQEKHYVDAGGQVLGVMQHPGDLNKILKVNPDVMHDMIVKHQIEMVPHVGSDGKQDGISVIKMPGAYRTTMLPAGATFHTFDQSTGQYVAHKTAGPVTQGEIDDYEHAAAAQALTYQNQKKEQDLKTAQIAKDNADASKAPSEIEEARARANEANAAAAKDIAEANKLKTVDPNDPAVANLGELAARGGLTEDMISGMGKNGRAAVESYLAQHHPNLDQKSIFMTANDRKMVTLAGNALHNIDGMAQILQRRPDLLGKINGLVTQGKTLAGTGDADISYIDEALDNYALATTGAHGTRAQGAREDAKKALLNSFKNGPAAVQSSITAARSSLSNLAAAGKPRGIDGTPYVYRQQGSGAPAAPQIPAGAKPGYKDGRLVGYQDAQGWHDLPAVK